MPSKCYRCNGAGREFDRDWDWTWRKFWRLFRVVPCPICRGRKSLPLSLSPLIPSGHMADYSVGDPVQVDSIEGFGGPAVVVAVRAESPHNKFKVLMDDGSQPPFWAHDFEVSPPAMADHDTVPYDSRPDTLDHIAAVRRRLAEVCDLLASRGEVHDLSKLVDPEKSAFDEFTPKLKGTTYGSDEYRAFLAAIKPALDHHYAANSHHPEHYPDGIAGMTLLDLVEMFCDWKAATERHADGNLARSIEINRERFNLDPQLVAILENTRAMLGW